MTVRGTLGLLGLFAALAAYLLLVPPPTPAPLPEPLLVAPAESVDSIEAIWPDRRLHVRRMGETWRSDAGVVVTPETITDLLATLSTLRPMETLSSRDHTADYGFAAAATTLVVSAAGATVMQLQVGDRNPAWTGVYVRRIGSDDIIVVGALLHWELEKLHAVATR